MPERSGKALDRLFRALASGPRREIMRLAAREKCAVTQIAAQLKMREPAASKHVRVLVNAALLSKTREGRYQWCRLNRDAFEPVCQSIEELGAWDEVRRSRKRCLSEDSCQRSSRFF